MKPWRWIVASAASLAMAGCGGVGESKPDEGKPEVHSKSSAELKRYAASELPSVEEPLPPLDDGRVLLSPPSGWRLLPRDPKYLVRLVKGTDNNSLPRITVAAEEAPEKFPDVSEDSAASFAAEIEKLSTAVAGRKVLEPERPIVVGELVWSRHVRQLRTRGGSGVAAVQSLTTARKGRLYTIELTVESPGESAAEIAKAVLAHRDAAYALAANCKFSGEAAEPASEPAATVETPGEKATSDGNAADKDPRPEQSPEKKPD